MTLPLPKGWTRHACAFDMAICLLIAQDDLLRPKHPMQQCFDDNIHEWLVGLVDPGCDLVRLPGNLTALQALIEAALRTPDAAHLYAVFCFGARVAYDAEVFAERALVELRAADLDFSHLLDGDC